MRLKMVIMIILIIFVMLGVFYALLWAVSLKKYPVEYGISFNQDYARSLGLNWKRVYEEMLRDLQPKYVRIAAMWSEIEDRKGVYDFANVDWMMDAAEYYNAKATLVVGQKAPRWPECHVPEWVHGLTETEYRDELFSYISSVVERYKNHPALEIWQVENEPFIKFRFGDCDLYRSELVPDEISAVRMIDDEHPILITDSGELSSWRRAAGMADIFGTTLYRVVRTKNGLVFSYAWVPPSFYRYKARLWGLDMDNVVVSELQAEPWFTNGGAEQTPIDVQLRTMSEQRLRDNIDYVERLGVKRAYFWGLEWWYWMKTKNNDDVYWQIGKQKIRQ